MTEFKEINIGTLFDLSIKTNSSFFTKAFIDQKKGNIPVYSASKFENIVGYGFIKDQLDRIKYFEDCLTWNIDGSIGKVFYRKGKFSLSEKVIPLILFDKYKSVLDQQYLKYILEIRATLEGYSFTKKAGKNRLKNLMVTIPIRENGEFDLEKQKEIASKYEQIEKIKDRIRITKEDIDEKSIRFEYSGIYSEVPISEVFELQRGKSEYTRQYGNSHKGEYPVFSAGREKLTSIHTYDFDGDYLTWATNGFAGYLKKLNGKFSINSDRGVFIPKSANIDIDFVRYSIQRDLRNLTKGRMGDKGKNEFTKLSPSKIKENITIRIPIDDNGEFDLEKQREIASKYKKLESIQKILIDELEYLERVKVEI